MVEQTVQLSATSQFTEYLSAQRTHSLLSGDLLAWTFQTLRSRQSLNMPPALLTGPNLLAVTVKLEDGLPRLAEVSLGDVGCCCEVRS